MSSSIRSGALLLGQVVGVGLLALLDWAAGVGLPAWVSHVYISTHDCPELAPQTILGHLGPQLGSTFHPQSLSLALVGASHQIYGASGPLHGMTGFWAIQGVKG